jgi:DTW domain-containing protein YfiP
MHDPHTRPDAIDPPATRTPAAFGLAEGLAPPPERRRDLCLVCNRARSSCFCSFVKQFDTRTRFVLLMHPKEFKQQKTGTGRMTRLALHNSEIVVGVDLSEHWRLKELLSDLRYFPVILFPGQGSANLSGGDALEAPEGKTLLVFVIDGTWRLAKKVVHLTRSLRTVPRICFTPPAKSRFYIKRQPADYCVSTIEAVHQLLEVLEKRGLERLDGRHDSLIEAIDSLVRFQQQYTGDSTRAPRHSGGARRAEARARERARRRADAEAAQARGRAEML